MPSFTLSFDLSSAAGLGELNTFLASRSYVVGFAPTSTDVALYTALGKAPDAGKYPNVFRFYEHIGSFTAEQKKKFAAGVSVSGAAVPATAAAPAPAAAAAPKPKAAEEDDEADLFGDDGEEAAKKASAAAVKAAAPAAKKEKAKPIAKTTCVYDVKPLEAGQDMKAMEAAVRSIEMDGLVWGEKFEVIDVAYGIQKLMIQCIVEDEKVSLDDLEEKLMAFEDIIQSVDQLSMNKL